jgi:putative transposase
MAFIRVKEIPPRSGNWYDYEVATVREGPRVRQKVLQYLGRHVSNDTAQLVADIEKNHFVNTFPSQKVSAITLKPIKEIIPDVPCKSCQSSNTRKYGLYKGVQNYFCNDCHSKFTGSDTLAHGRISPSHIAGALNEYYCGLSYREIENDIRQKTGGTISHTAVQNWVRKYTDKAISQTKELHPLVGDTWVAGETFLGTGGQSGDPEGVVIRDVMDDDTRFLLATVVTVSGNIHAIKQLLELAAERAGKTPQVIITDKPDSYIDGIELAHGSDAKYRQGFPFRVESSPSLIGRFHYVLKDRPLVMRGPKNISTLTRFTGGWLIHYNFFRPNESLGNRTPAVVAGLQYACMDWDCVVGAEKTPLIKTLVPETISGLRE